MIGDFMNDFANCLCDLIFCFQTLGQKMCKGAGQRNNVFVVGVSVVINHFCKQSSLAIGIIRNNGWGSQIEKMIKHQTNGHGWEFMFLGANMDAVKEAQDIGINVTRAVSYDWTTMGTNALYNTVGAAACATKSCTMDGINLQATYDACMSNIDDALSTAKSY